MGIYRRNKEREHTFDQESDQEEKKKDRKHALDQESKIQEKTIPIKKKEGRKWKSQIRI